MSNEQLTVTCNPTENVADQNFSTIICWVKGAVKIFATMSLGKITLKLDVFIAEMQLLVFPILRKKSSRSKNVGKLNDFILLH